MTQDEIIEMAQTLSHGWWLDDEKLEAFAKLVAARTLMNIDPSSFMSWQEGFEAGAAKEREACAKTVEKIETYEKIEKACFKFAAKTIRARN